ncbi:MAG: alpha/beta fold hydrolase [Gammaproteobacteria bacterium]
MNNQLGHHWILLTGLTRESAHWGDFIPLLSAAFPTAKITPLDLPGTGRYYKDISPDTIETITDKVRTHADYQKVLQRPATIIGLSLGAMVAWRWLQTYPAEIAGGVLVCPSFGGLSPFYHRLRWQTYGKIAAMAFQSDVRRREQAILKLISNSKGLNDQTVDEWEKIQKERPVSPQNAFRHVIAAMRFEPGETKPARPILLLNSEGDKLVSPACSVAIHKKWDIELRTHPWGGHDLPLDDASWVISQLQDWVFANNGD